LEVKAAYELLMEGLRQGAEMQASQQAAEAQAAALKKNSVDSALAQAMSVTLQQNSLNSRAKDLAATFKKAALSETEG
jgi:hypothetical protein